MARHSSSTRQPQVTSAGGYHGKHESKARADDEAGVSAGFEALHGRRRLFHPPVKVRRRSPACTMGVSSTRRIHTRLHFKLRPLPCFGFFVCIKRRTFRLRLVEAAKADLCVPGDPTLGFVVLMEDDLSPLVANRSAAAERYFSWNALHPIWRFKFASRSRLIYRICMVSCR